MASSRSNSVPTPLIALLVAAGVAVGVRAVQLAALEWTKPKDRQAQASEPVVPPTEPMTTAAAALPGLTPSQLNQTPSDVELRAMIAAACPHALELMEAEGGLQPIRLPPVEEVATSGVGADASPSPSPSPEGRGIKDLRVAMRPMPHNPSLRVAQRDNAWLVPPDNWYAPEDRSKPEERREKEEAPATTGEIIVVNEPDTVELTPEPIEESPAPVEETVDKPELPVMQAPWSMQDQDAESAAPEPNARHTEPSIKLNVDEAETSPAPVQASPNPERSVEQPVEEPASPSEMPFQSPSAEAPAQYPSTDAPSPRVLPFESAEPEAMNDTALDDDDTGPEFLPSGPPSTEATSVSKDHEPESKPAKPLFPSPRPKQPAPSATPAPPVQPAAPSPHSATAAGDSSAAKSGLTSIEAHRDLFATNCFPSARECGECHKKHYEEWRISSHAYAFVSPMFQKFEQKITNLSQGTVGYFCYRCHSPVATTIGEHRATPLWDMPKVAREGVTCVACHRINERYTKANGERRIIPGDIYSPVHGGLGGGGVAEAIARKDHYKVKTSPDQKGAGQAIHLEGRYFDQLTHAEFCTSCHQVAVHPGIKLEVVWEQYRQSPACKKGVTCQDCHMGLQPGEASGYEVCSIAEVGGKSVNQQRKHANHIFYGPNYSISHPGVFPDNKDADRWKIHEWLKFNWRAGWGTDDFEDSVDDGKLVVAFPKEWQDVDDRYDAREIIEDNLKALDKKREVREEVMNHSLRITGPFFKHAPATGRDLRLYYDVTNMNEGHNVLTASLGAQPQLWANVVLIGPDGRRLWETGYTDSDGDVCDIHSRDVRVGRAPFDHQLFNLQTMFLITGATGTDREMPLPVNMDIDQLPFLRPGAIPITTTNHPPFIRMESRSIAPLGTKRVHYKVPGELLCRPGKYRLSFRMRNRIEPIWFMRFCDATDEMVRMMNEGMLDVQPRSVEFWVR